MTVTAQLSAASGHDVTVPFTLTGDAVLDTDYTTDVAEITIPAGSTTGDLVITVVNDSEPESSEDIIVTMGTPTNATASGTTVHTATITDTDT